MNRQLRVSERHILGTLLIGIAIGSLAGLLIARAELSPWWGMALVGLALAGLAMLDRLDP